LKSNRNYRISYIYPYLFKILIMYIQGLNKK